MGKIRLGTSGWGYEEWIGPFYVKREKKFSEYTRVFNTAEINSTFYRYPAAGMIYGLIRAPASRRKTMRLFIPSCCDEKTATTYAASRSPLPKKPWIFTFLTQRIKSISFVVT